MREASLGSAPLPEVLAVAGSSGAGSAVDLPGGGWDDAAGESSVGGGVVGFSTSGAADSEGAASPGRTSGTVPLCPRAL